MRSRLSKDFGKNEKSPSGVPPARQRHAGATAALRGSAPALPDRAVRGAAPLAPAAPVAQNTAVDRNTAWLSSRGEVRPMVVDVPCFPPFLSRGRVNYGRPHEKASCR